MRRTASEMLNELEMRIARLERQAGKSKNQRSKSVIKKEMSELQKSIDQINYLANEGIMEGSKAMDAIMPLLEKKSMLERQLKG